MTPTYLIIPTLKILKIWSIPPVLNVVSTETGPNILIGFYQNVAHKILGKVTKFQNHIRGLNTR